MGRKKKTTEDWVRRAKACHDDRYDYSCSVYTGSHEKIQINCKKHGVFEMGAGEFLKGNNCPKCALEERRIGIEEYIERANKVHGGKYTYAPSERTRYIKITCPFHGEFEQDKFSHLAGCGCPQCGNIKRRNESKDRDDLLADFIKRARAVHGDRYDYSKVVYVNNTTPVIITCKKHGDFEMKPTNHINGGNNCPVCAKEAIKEKNVFTQEEFEAKARAIHGDKYTYGEYKGMRVKMDMFCPIHGHFSMLPTNHTDRCDGCPQCGRESARQKKFLTQEEFIQRATDLHHGKYDYSITVYNGRSENIQYICHEKDKYGNEHGIITQPCTTHLMGFGCPKCHASRLEVQTEHYLKERGFDYIHQKRFSWLGRQSLDFYLPSLNIAIECQGEQHYRAVTHFGGDDNLAYVQEMDAKKLHKCLTHGVQLYYYTNEKGVSNNIRTFNVLEALFNVVNPIPVWQEEFGGEVISPDTLLCNGVEIHYIRSVQRDRGEIQYLIDAAKKDNKRPLLVCDFEWAENKELVMGKIRSIVGKTENNRTYAPGRKCDVVVLSSDEANNFISKNHIQGRATSTISYAAKYGDSIVGVMSFKRESAKDDKWELVRFATDPNFRCPGVGGKLFKTFIKEKAPREVKSFADRRWSDIDDNLYVKLGFVLDGIVPPDYKYVGLSGIPMHKFGFRKQKLSKKFGFDPSLTERQMTEKLYLTRTYNAGLLRYVFRRV